MNATAELISFFACQMRLIDCIPLTVHNHSINLHIFDAIQLLKCNLFAIHRKSLMENAISHILSQRCVKYIERERCVDSRASDIDYY